MSAILLDPSVQFLDANGDPAPAGSVIRFFDAGTTTLKGVYSDATLSTAVSDDLALDADGKLPVTIYCPSGESYFWQVRTATGGGGTVVDEADNVWGYTNTSNIQVSSITQLKSLNPADGDIVSTSGYYTIDDGGHGEYVFDASSTATDNGGTVIAPDSGTGRWLLRHKGIVNTKQFGCIHDGVATAANTTRLTAARDWWTSTMAGVYGNTYPESTQVGLHFPSGHLNCATEVNLAATGTGGLLFGDGVSSQLEGVSITHDQRDMQCRDFWLRGSATFGIRVDATTNSVRGGNFTNIVITDKTYGIHMTGIVSSFSAHTQWNNITCQRNTTGLWIETQGGCQFSNCHFRINNLDGIHITGGEEAKFTNCTSISNSRNNLRIEGNDASVAQGVYCSNCTFTVASSLVDTYKETNAIASAADNGAGGTTLTLTGAHTLVEALQGSIVSGTTSYNGTHDVFNVTDTTVDIAVAFVANETGTLTRPEWDVWCQGTDNQARCRDLYFTGGNINFVYLDNVYNVKFDSGRNPKEQLYLTNDCNRIFRMGGARGRQTDPELDIQISGQKNGWGEVIYSDESGSTAPGSGGVMLRSPNEAGTMVGNLVDSHHEVFVGDSGAVSSSMRSGVTATLSDDTAVSFKPLVPIGMMLITNSAATTSFSTIINFNTSTPTTGEMIAATNIEVSTGILTGTTGTDGVLTVSAHTDGLIYIENRTGGNQRMTYFVIG